ncbi:MAG: hypothetical protein ABS69_09075 [Nitrosomonadales bacterium SCN 54-20]|nr:MAG: hypothetical protein ABS69_09075 [Nitrosomonadales bacterium SCN 54-20]
MRGTSKTRKTDVGDVQWLATLARAGRVSGKSERKTLEKARRYWAGIGMHVQAERAMQTERRNRVKLAM